MRYLLAENTYAMGRFATGLGAGVILTLYNVSTGNSVPLDTNVCTELGITGYYQWNTSNITTLPVTKIEYLWVMTDGSTETAGKFVLGGFPDGIKDQTDNLPIDPADQSLVEAAITASIDDIVDGVWDELLTGATHNIPTSAGRRLRALAGCVITEGTAVSATINTIVLNGDASDVDGAYDPAQISIVAGTGYGQTRGIFEYFGDTKTVIVDRNWRTSPDGTSEYTITSWSGREQVNEGLALGGTLNTITLNVNASSIDEVYVRQYVFIRSGTGDDQVRTVIAYDGTTKIATVDNNWAIIPDLTSAYVMIPARGETKELIALAVSESYAGKIYFDPVNGAAGIDAPQGIEKYPIDNIDDVITVCIREGIAVIHVVGTLDLDSGVDVGGYTFTSYRSVGNVITLTDCFTVGTYFDNLTVSGIMNGRGRFTYCAIPFLNNFDGGIKNSLLLGKIQFSGTALCYLTDTDTFVNSPGDSVELDVGDSVVNIIKAAGNYTISNKTGSSLLNIGMRYGDITIASSCVTGAIHLDDSGHIKADNSGAGCILEVEGLTRESILDVLGIQSENAKWSDLDYDDNHNLKYAIITQYEDATLTVVRQAWEMTATYDADSELLTYQTRKL